MGAEKKKRSILSLNSSRNGSRTSQSISSILCCSFVQKKKTQEGRRVNPTQTYESKIKADSNKVHALQLCPCSHIISVQFCVTADQKLCERCPAVLPHPPDPRSVQLFHHFFCLWFHTDPGARPFLGPSQSVNLRQEPEGGRTVSCLQRFIQGKRKASVHNWYASAFYPLHRADNVSQS